MSHTVDSVEKTEENWLVRMPGKWLSLFRAIPFVVLILNVQSEFGMTVDDPYITFRYAWNFIHGYGPVFNVGDPVEGFTSPLHLCLCTLALLVAPAVDILFKAKLISLLFAVLTLVQTRKLTRLCGLSEWQTTCVLLIMALDRNVAIAASNGLETTLYAFLLLTAVLTFIDESRSNRGIWSSCLFFLATMARPDNIVVVAGLMACRAYLCYRRKLPLSFLIAWALPYVILFSAFEGMRYAYFAQLLPNTYYAKHVALSTGVRNGLSYLLHGFSLAHRGTSGAANALFVLLIAGVTCLGFIPLAKPRTHSAIILVVVICQLLFILKSGGDWMTGWRFVVPVYPYLAIGLVRGFYAIGLRVLLQLRRPIGRLPLPELQHAGTVVALGLLSAACFVRLVENRVLYNASWAQVGFSTRGANLIDGTGEQFRNGWVQGSDFIRRTYPAGSVIAYSEMGYTSYENLDIKFIDLRGLNDREISHLGSDTSRSAVGFADMRPYSTNDPFWRTVLSKKPDAILFLSTTLQWPNGDVPDYHRRVISFGDFSLLEFRRSVPRRITPTRSTRLFNSCSLSFQTP